MGVRGSFVVGFVLEHAAGGFTSIVDFGRIFMLDGLGVVSILMSESMSDSMSGSM